MRQVRGPSAAASVKAKGASARKGERGTKMKERGRGINPILGKSRPSAVNRADMTRKNHCLFVLVLIIKLF